MEDGRGGLPQHRFEFFEDGDEGFVDYYNHRRVHESLDNLTPADVYLDRGDKIISARQLVKEHTLRQRRRENLGLMPLTQEPPKPQTIRVV